MADDSRLVKLEDFIKETLEQIIVGVKQANELAVQNGALVNPPTFRTQDGYLHYNEATHKNDNAQEIEFDIAITAIEKSDAKGGAGVFVSVIGLGAQLREGLENSTVSRIKFSVPLRLPPSGK